MKTLVLIIICIFSVFAYAKDYRSLDADSLYSQLADTGRAVSFSPTAEMKRAVGDIKDPTERMLNFTFWQSATVKEVQRLIKAGADINARVDVYANQFGLHMLDFAILSGKRELVWAVLDAAPSTNYRSGGTTDGYRASGYSPLMIAASIFPNDLAMMKRIVKLGCNPNMISDHFTALTYAERTSSPEVYKYIFSVTSPTLRMHTKPFWQTATAETVRREIKNGADINHATFLHRSRTALWYALQYSRDGGSIQALIDAGARLRSDSEGFDSYIYKNQSEKIVEILIKSNLQIGARVIDKTGLNIRAEPNATSAIVGKPLPEGTRVIITGLPQGNWVPISYWASSSEGYSGFVYKPLIKPNDEFLSEW